MKFHASGRFASAAILLGAISPAGFDDRPVRAQGATPAIGTMSFRALGADGQPVTDLKPGDVSLKLDNTPREIRSLNLVSLGAPTGAASALPAAIPPAFATNAAASAPSRRSAVILVDEESVAPGKEQGIREAAGEFLSGLAPGDRVAVLSLRQGGPQTALTTDHAAAKKALASLGGYGSGRENASDLRCRTLRLVQNLQGVFTANTAGASGTVLLFSTSVAALQPGQMARIGGSSDLCELRTEHFTQLGTAAQSSRANFYVIELMDGAGAPPLAEAAGGLENLAGVTSGEMVRLGSNFGDQMRRILRETSAYYLVSFEDGGRSGQSRQVALTVARDGVAVRAPGQLPPPRPPTKAASVSPRDMIRSAEAFSDLPLRAVGYSSRNSGDKKIRVLAIFEPLEAGTKVNAAMIGLFDQTGSLKAQWTAQNNELGSSPVIAALVVEPGSYRMRVAATDSKSRAGAVDFDLAAAIIEAGPIHLGDLVLGRITQTGPAPVMQFGSEEEAVAMIELYGRPAGPLTAYVDVTTRGEGEPLVAVPLSPSATSEPDKFILSARVPLTSLKPGDYLVRAVVGLKGQEKRVTRTLRKTGS